MRKKQFFLQISSFFAPRNKTIHGLVFGKLCAIDYK